MRKKLMPSLLVGVAGTVLVALTFVGALAVAYAGTPLLNCATVKTLEPAKVRPVWFPSPQPAGTLVVNATVPIFGPGLEWTAGGRYVFLGRVPGGANLGAPFPTKVTDPYLPNFHGKLQVWRLAPVEESRLYAEWQTSAGNRADLSYVVGKGESVATFVAVLRSLHPILWPKRCPAQTARPGDQPSTARVATPAHTYHSDLTAQTADTTGYYNALWKVWLRGRTQITINWSQTPSARIQLNILPGEITNRTWANQEPLLSSHTGSNGHIAFVFVAAASGWYYLDFGVTKSPGPYTFSLSRPTRDCHDFGC